MTFSYDELTKIKNALEFGTIGFNGALIAKVNGLIEDHWHPLSELPPLNIAVIVSSNDKSFAAHMIRTELAESYSPANIKMLDLNKREDLMLETKYFKWRRI